MLALSLVRIVMTAVPLCSLQRSYIMATAWSAGHWLGLDRLCKVWLHTELCIACIHPQACVFYAYFLE